MLKFQHHSAKQVAKLIVAKCVKIRAPLCNWNTKFRNSCQNVILQLAWGATFYVLSDTLTIKRALCRTTQLYTEYWLAWTNLLGREQSTLATAKAQPVGANNLAQPFSLKLLHVSPSQTLSCVIIRLCIPTSLHLPKICDNLHY